MRGTRRPCSWRMECCGTLERGWLNWAQFWNSLEANQWTLGSLMISSNDYTRRSSQAYCKGLNWAWILPSSHWEYSAWQLSERSFHHSSQGWTRWLQLRRRTQRIPLALEGCTQPFPSCCRPKCLHSQLLEQSSQRNRRLLGRECHLIDHSRRMATASSSYRSNCTNQLGPIPLRKSL